MNKALISIILFCVLITNVYAQPDSKYIITPHLGLSAIVGDNDLSKFYTSGVCFGLGGAYLLSESVSFHLNGTYHFSSFRFSFWISSRAHTCCDLECFS